MKYKVVVNGLAEITDCSCIEALNTVCDVMTNSNGITKIQIYRQEGNSTVGFCWKLENSFGVDSK